MISACKTVTNHNNQSGIPMIYIANSVKQENSCLTTLSDSSILKKYEHLYSLNETKLLNDLRSPVWRPSLNELNIDQSGKIELMVCVEKSGKTSFVKILPEKTSICSQKSLSKAVCYLSKFEWEEKRNGPDEECGKYTLIIDTKK